MADRIACSCVTCPKCGSWVGDTANPGCNGRREVARQLSRVGVWKGICLPLPDRGEHPVAGTKDQLHYLLHQKRVLDVPSAVLETVARIDGGTVLDRDSSLLAFGAILRHPDLADLHPDNIEGGRTTAAISASRFGNVLKISEDGMISFFQNGKFIWEI